MLSFKDDPRTRRKEKEKKKLENPEAEWLIENLFQYSFFVVSVSARMIGQNKEKGHNIPVCT